LNNPSELKKLAMETPMPLKAVHREHRAGSREHREGTRLVIHNFAHSQEV